MSDHESEEEFESAEEDAGATEEGEGSEIDKEKTEESRSDEKTDQNEEATNPTDPIETKKEEKEEKEEEKQPEAEKTEEKVENPEKSREVEAKDIRHALKSLVKEEKQEKPKESGWGSWGSWLSSTVGAVADSASVLGQGIQSAIHSVEESLGVPEPEVIASKGDESRGEDVQLEPIKAEPIREEDKPEESAPEESASVSAPVSGKTEDESEGFFSIWSGVGAFGSALASKSGKLVSGGIDALEALGRKTMDVLSEGDPGLRRKRAALAELTGTSRPALSQVLRDAKSKAELSAEQKTDVVSLVHFSTLFDDCQGFVHLEALELLSTESSTKLQNEILSLEDEKDKEIFDELESIKDNCKIDEEVENPSEDFDFGKEIRLEVESLKISYNGEKLIETENKIRNKLEETDPESTPESLYESGVQCLAELTSKTVEFLRKSGELILVPSEETSSSSSSSSISLSRSQALRRITIVTCQVVSSVSAQYAERMNQVISKIDDPSDAVKGSVSSLYLEASNCTTYIQDALQLLQPVLQLSFIHQTTVAPSE